MHPLLPTIILNIEETYPGPLIARGYPGTQDNKYGFEGGRVLYHENAFHLFTAERFDDPEIVKMRLAHWQSADGLRWERVSTLFESSGKHTGADPRAALWSPMPFFNDEEDRWNLFYVGYRSKPNDPTGWYLNYEGRIFRAVSTDRGRKGLGGPYEDIGVVLEPDADCDSWEGLQGIDSFYLYEAQERWFAFYGSARTERIPCNYWGTGLASAPRMSGPWQRCTELNPVVMDTVFAENPVVTRLENGTYVAMIDGREKIGYSTSPDGLHWSRAAYLNFPEPAIWWHSMRTPLCLLPLESNRFALFFTAISKHFGCLGRVDITVSARLSFQAGR